MRRARRVFAPRAWTSAELQELVAQARKLSGQMEEATNELNAALREAEELLVEKWPDRAAAVELDSQTVLLLGPWGERRGLFVLFAASQQVVPLANTSRRIRMDVVPLLPLLADQLTYDDEIDPLT